MPAKVAIVVAGMARSYDDMPPSSSCSTFQASQAFFSAPFDQMACGEVGTGLGKDGLNGGNTFCLQLIGRSVRHGIPTLKFFISSHGQ